MIQPRILKNILLIIAILLVLPISVKAYNLDDIKIDNPWTIKSFTNSQADICVNDDDTLLGNPECEDTVAWLLQKILNYIRVIGPSLAVILSAIDFAKVIVTSDNDSMKKAQSKLIKRLIAAALLFFVPTLVIVILDLIGISSSKATQGLH